MKKTLRLTAIVTVVMLVAAFLLAGCEFTRKLGGAERTFPSKISGAKTLSFKMNVNYQKGEEETDIVMDCFKSSEGGVEQYAYVYSCSRALNPAYTYKNIYTGGKLYQIVNVTANAGTYHVKDGVSIKDSGNILYHVTHNILLTGVAAMFSKAKKETVNGDTAYRYDVTIEGKNVSLWYNSEALVRIQAEFENKEDGSKEKYTIDLSDYSVNGTLADSTFLTPDEYGPLYIESPFSFEEWMSVMTSFSGKFGG